MCAAQNRRAAFDVFKKPCCAFSCGWNLSGSVAEFVEDTEKEIPEIFTLTVINSIVSEKDAVQYSRPLSFLYPNENQLSVVRLTRHQFLVL